jgi:hypothetical protein
MFFSNLKPAAASAMPPYQFSGGLGDAALPI